MATDIVSLIDDEVVVGDGAIAAMSAALGVGLRTGCEAALTHADVLADAYRAFVDAGARLLRTNTLEANPHALESAGLAGRGPEIWSAAVRICREAGGPDAIVAGAAGPMGGAMRTEAGLTEDDVRAGYRRQFEVMLGGPIDLAFLEGFRDLAELQAAVAAVRELDGSIPVAATVDVSGGAEGVAAGEDSRIAVEHLGALGIELAGVSCSVGDDLDDVPADLGPMMDGSLIAVLHAGTPGAVGCDPAAVGRGAAMLISRGARVVAGGHGCAPEHILQIARAASAAT